MSVGSPGKLRIVLLEDDPRTRDAIKTLLMTTLFGEVDIPWAENISAGVQKLQTAVTDLAIVDCRVPRNSDDDTIDELGGVVALQACREALGRARTKTIVYSASAKAASRARELFQADRLLGKSAVVDDLLEPCLTLLRSRVSELLANDVVRGEKWAESGGVSVGDRFLSARSLLAPLYQELDGSKQDFPDQSLAELCDARFACDTRSRVLSYLFKGGSFIWPANPMYGLTPLGDFGGRGEPTSGLDVLTHGPYVPNAASPTLRQAAEAVVRDLERLKGVLNSSTVERVLSFAKAAMSWESWGRVQRRRTSEFEKEGGTELFRVTLKAIVEVLKGGSESATETDACPVDWSELRKIEVYCEMVEGGSGPLLLNGLGLLREGVAGYADASGVTWGSLVRYCGRVLVGRASVDPAEATMPFLHCAIGHSGEGFSSDEDLAIAIGKDHPLGRAAARLEGYASWVLLEGTTKHRTILRGSASDAAGDTWRRCKDRYDWNVVHFLRIGLPLARVYPRRVGQ